MKIFNKSIFGLLILIITHINLSADIVNPGFETGSLDGWTHGVPGGYGAVGIANWESHSGAYSAYLSGGSHGHFWNAFIEQNFETDETSTIISWWMKPWCIVCYSTVVRATVTNSNDDVIFQKMYCFEGDLCHYSGVCDEFIWGASWSQVNTGILTSSNKTFTIKLELWECNVGVHIDDFLTEVEPYPVAYFTASDTIGIAPLTVQFTDLSTPQDSIISWHWDFGDGYIDTLQNPIHTYETAGVYDVTLIVSNGTISDTLTKTDYITVYFDTDFSANPTSGYYPLVVQFTDLTQGNPTEWKWYFGDGDSSEVQNPPHTFWNPGDYDITLIVSNGAMSDTLTKLAYITVDSLLAPLDEPQIYRINDMPNDQGHNVRLYWVRSLKDAQGVYPWILFYSIWRRIDDLLKDDRIINLISEEELSKYNQANFDRYKFVISGIESDYWEGVGTVGAIHLDWYSFVAPTLVDSGSTGINWSVFKIYAHTNINTFYESLPDSGYSIDNIPPNPVEEIDIMRNANNVEISWTEVTEGSYNGNSYPELNGVWYKVYGSYEPYFECSPSTYITTTEDLNYIYNLTGEEKKFFKVIVSDQP